MKILISFVFAFVHICGVLVVSQSPTDVVEVPVSPSPSPGPSPGPSNATGGVGEATTYYTATARLPPLIAVRSCLPFNILVKPRNDSEVATLVELRGDQAVVKATVLSASTAGLLTLSIAQGFVSTNPINLTIYTNDTQTLQFVQNSGAGSVVVGPGYDVNTLDVRTSGLGKVFVLDVQAKLVDITSKGSGTVYLRGNLTDATVQANGIHSIYLLGSVTGKVTAEFTGINQLYVQSTPGASISAKGSSSQNVVNHFEGTCTTEGTVTSSLSGMLRGSNPFAPICRRILESQLPMFSHDFSCGLRVDGSTNCTGNDVTSPVEWSVNAPPGAEGEANDTLLADKPPAEEEDMTFTVAEGADTPKPAGPDPEIEGTFTSPSPKGTVRQNPVQSDFQAASGFEDDFGGGPSSGGPAPFVEPTGKPAGDGVSTSSSLSGFKISEAPGVTTVATTTGPGSFSSATGSVSGTGGGFTQTTTSTGGDPPVTTSAPVFLANTIDPFPTIAGGNTASSSSSSTGPSNEATGLAIASEMCSDQSPGALSMGV